MDRHTLVPSLVQSQCLSVKFTRLTRVLRPRLRWLKVLDGKPVTSREMGDSQKIFEGKLTYDALLEKVRPASFEDMQVRPDLKCTTHYLQHTASLT